MPCQCHCASSDWEGILDVYEAVARQGTERGPWGHPMRTGAVREEEAEKDICRKRAGRASGSGYWRYKKMVEVFKQFMKDKDLGIGDGDSLESVSQNSRRCGTD